MADQNSYDQENQQQTVHVCQLHKPQRGLPKDSYSQPSINQLVEKSSTSALLSFMDAHLGYNQVQMAWEDEE